MASSKIHRIFHPFFRRSSTAAGGQAATISSSWSPLLSLTYQVSGMTVADCLNLNTLTGTYLPSLPTDPVLGSAAKTYYALRKTATSRVHVEACNPEVGEMISVEQ